MSGQEDGRKPRSRAHAEMTITVQHYESAPYDQTASPALLDIGIRETFSGDLAGEGTVRCLQVLREDRSASYVAVERFRGKLGELQGTFVLQGPGSVEHGKIKGTWLVVPGCGSGDLSGLRGEGGFEGELGKGSRGVLDYWFE